MSLALTAVVLVALVIPTASATPLATKKAEAKAKAEKIRGELATLDMNLEKTIEAYNLANLKLADVQANVEKTTRDLKVARFELQVARQTLSDRLVAMYKQRPTDVLDVVFAARSFNDLMDQLDTVRQLGAQDARIVDQVKRAEAVVSEKRDRLVSDRARARSLVAQIKTRRQGIESTLVSRKQMLRGVEAEIKQIERQLAEAAARAARAAAAAAASRSAGAGQPSGPGQNPRPIPSGPLGTGHPEVIAIARKYLGVPYLYGGASPKTGFDCSGLAMYVYAQIGINLPHYSGYQQNLGTPVPMNALVPGDLVFKGYPVSYHVAIYAGGGQVIEAPYTGAVVWYSTVWDFQYAVRLP